MVGVNDDKYGGWYKQQARLARNESARLETIKISRIKARITFGSQIDYAGEGQSK